MRTDLADNLAQAKADLLSLLQSSLEQGRYAEVEVLARIAEVVASALARESDPGLQAAPGPNRTSTRKTLGVPLEASSVNPLERSPPRRAADSEFPRFLREGDRLVKIGWSKRHRAEYQHKAPREVVDTVLTAILDKVGEETVFEAAEVFPLEDPKSGKAIPSYQSYLALAWLQKEALIEKKGREGYLLRQGQGRRERIESSWKALPAIGHSKKRKAH